MRASCLLLALSVALLCACPPDRDPGTSDDDDDDATAEACTGVEPLTEACIELAPTYTFTLADAAAGVEIPYTVVISADVPGVRSLPQDAGGCGQPDASGLSLFERLSGGDQGYCECDVGLCPSPDPAPSLLGAGTFDRTFSWTGLNWAGPSDTGNPMGAPFPPGQYTLLVNAIGTVDGADYTVSASSTITLIE
ncbi:MAG: hypothetical protein KDA24_30060 [Deltaproteobacteria bacterium]|nr:hypothetical protein [Deltaproteobacteria bacterium]